MRDGKYFARFVAYIEANTVRERLDATIPGEWDLTLELLPALIPNDADDTGCAFKARLQILGVIREDVGFGKDYKQAATDAFKRAAVRFGVGHELYAYEQNWVQVDGDGKFAKPLEDPGEAYARRQQRKPVEGAVARSSAPTSASGPTSSTSAPSTSSIEDRAPLDEPEPSCPKCGGKMWDNRTTKRNPKAPDAKCRSRSCDGVVWKWADAVAKPASFRGDGLRTRGGQTRARSVHVRGAMGGTRRGRTALYRASDPRRGFEALPGAEGGAAPSRHALRWQRVELRAAREG
jgi:hypothetical protein